MNKNKLKAGMSRREMLKSSLVLGGGATLLGSRIFNPPAAMADLYTEVFPTSPLIGGYLDSSGKVQGSAFNDPLPIPRALAPTPLSEVANWSNWPGSGQGQQCSDGTGTHQIWPSKLGLPDPLIYRIELKVAPHDFTSLSVLAIGKDGKPTTSYDEGRTIYPAGILRRLPSSCIYGFNGTFPGPRINAEYGKPCLIRFINRLQENPYNLDRCDFGAPDWKFLTHLHNGHTAPESDGQPHYRPNAYGPGEWCDNLYLNYPAGGDDKEKQSFFWFHDHRMDFTGANVYKGMVGLYPIYDPAQSKDMGDETKGFRLPGVRTNNADGSFDVDYDIPLAFYDCRLDDGVTMHHDYHDGLYPLAGDPNYHPEWWGKTYFRHFPNHGFVGDVFTVNGTAYPVLEVKRRKYRLRFLDASIARIYQFQLMTGHPQSAASLGYQDVDLQGQYRLPDGQQCMRFLQIATDGGLLSTPVTRDSFELWPAKRREFIVDFTKYMDGSPTKKGDVIYLTNVMKMTDGRMWNSSDPKYKVPVLKIVIGDDAPDNSQIPTALRALPNCPLGEWKKAPQRTFTLSRGSSSTNPEVEWVINNQPFDPTVPLAYPKMGSDEVWQITNGGGGWVHPFHLHMEEHRVISRNGVNSPDARHPDDTSKEDVIALDPGETVLIYRYFRDFTGPYVAHCHNLAHEDHAMMFGWTIVP